MKKSKKHLKRKLTCSLNQWDNTAAISKAIIRIFNSIALIVQSLMK